MSKLEQRFPGKRVLITGATTGFGEALACQLAARGWKVAVTGRKPDAVQRTVDKVNALGGSGLGLLLEVREMAQWQDVREALEKAWGGIDILVNNAGVADANQFDKLTDADWDSLLSINLIGVINGCRTYCPEMSKNRSGYILNMASAAGLLAFPEMANYNVSKAGVVGLSETLFTELSRFNIGVTVLCPAGFKSSLSENGGGICHRGNGKRQSVFHPADGIPPGVAAQAADAQYLLPGHRLAVPPSARSVCPLTASLIHSGVLIHEQHLHCRHRHDRVRSPSRAQPRLAGR